MMLSLKIVKYSKKNIYILQLQIKKFDIMNIVCLPNIFVCPSPIKIHQHGYSNKLYIAWSFVVNSLRDDLWVGVICVHVPISFRSNPMKIHQHGYKTNYANLNHFWSMGSNNPECLVAVTYLFHPNILLPKGHKNPSNYVEIMSILLALTFLARTHVQTHNTHMLLTSQSPFFLTAGKIILLDNTLYNGMSCTTSEN